MCAAPSAAASLGGPLPSPSCSTSLPFCSLFKLPHHFCSIFTHSHAVTHALAHASTHPACLGVAYISLPINATSAEHSYRLSLTHSRSCTCSHYTHTRAHTHTHTHTHAHTYSHTHTHTCMRTPVFYIPGHLAIPWVYCGLPRWHSCKESACKCRRYKRHRPDSWVWKIPWMRK